VNKAQGLTIGLAILAFSIAVSFGSCRDKAENTQEEEARVIECECVEKTHLHVHFNFDEKEPDETDWPDDTDEPEVDDEVCGCPADCDDCLPKITTVLHNEETIVVKEVGVIIEELNIFIAMFEGIYTEFITDPDYSEYAFLHNIRVIYLQKGEGILWPGQYAQGIKYPGEEYSRHGSKALIIGCDADREKICKYLVDTWLFAHLWFEK